MAIPSFDSGGSLPPGIHWAEWAEFEARFGQSAYRRRLLTGLFEALLLLKTAGSATAYIDGSFVTTKEEPGDFDACWEVTGVDDTKVDPIFFTFDRKRAAQKARFLGEFFPAEWREGGSGRTWLDFFQIDKDTGEAKGIVAIDLRRLRQ